MKSKHIILTLLCIYFSQTTEAQLFKKLKKNFITEISSKQNDSRPIVNQHEADLHLQNSVQPLSTNLGGTVTFTITVNNKGPAKSEDIVARIHIPSSYNITNISVTHGSYNQDNKLWEIKSLEARKRAIMTIMVVVINDRDLMTTGEIISCSTQDPDSEPNNGIDTDGDGNIIDDKDDEDDGDGQNVLIGGVSSNNSSTNNTENNNTNTDDSNNNSTDTNNNGISGTSLEFDQDIKLVIQQGKNKIISFLDFDTMAMRVEYHSKGKNPDPVYWDKDGYIYSSDKKQYYKIPFSQIKSMGKNMIKMFSMGGGTEWFERITGMELKADWPNKPILYNGYELHVYPNRYPMIEWVFIYHPDIFRGANGVREESISCRNNSGCTKFTVTSGESIGATILFDSKNRLAEITNPDGSLGIYTYEPTTVTLPRNPQEFNFNFRN